MSAVFGQTSRLFGFGAVTRANRATTPQTTDVGPDTGSGASTFDAERRRMCLAGDGIRAKQRPQGLVMLVVELDDLAEVRALFGAPFAREAVRRTLARLGTLAGRDGVVVRTDVGTFVVLVPEPPADDAVERLRSATGREHALEFELDGQEMILLPESLVRRVHADESVEHVYDTLCGDIAQARRSERRHQECLRRERESYTRPAPLACAPRAPAAREHAEREYTPELPPTMAVPLAAH